MKYAKLLLLLLVLSIAVSAQNRVKPMPVEQGVSFQLAQYRHAIISNLIYDIKLLVPESRTEAVFGNITIHFTLKSADQSLQIDFKKRAYHYRQKVPAQGR
jgi:aminopeptidase N